MRGNNINKVSEQNSQGVCRNVTGWQKTQEARVESKGQTEEMPAGHPEEAGLPPAGSEDPGQGAQWNGTS